MHIKFGDKVVNVEMVNGVPTIKAYAEEIKHADGRQDVIVHVPCMSFSGVLNGTNK